VRLGGPLLVIDDLIGTGGTLLRAPRAAGHAGPKRDLRLVNNRRRLHQKFDLVGKRGFDRRKPLDRIQWMIPDYRQHLTIAARG